MMITTLFCQEIFDEIWIEMVQRTLRMILVLSAPMLMAAIITGIAVAMFQAVTKVQEQTLSFIPKIVATFYAMVLYLPAAKTECEKFLLETFNYVSMMKVDAFLK